MGWRLGCETLWHNVDVSVATYRRHVGTVAQQELVAATSQSLPHSGRLPTLVIPIAILGVTLRQHPRIGQLHTAHWSQLEQQGVVRYWHCSGSQSLVEAAGVDLSPQDNNAPNVST